MSEIKIDKIIRSNRRTFSIEIHKDGKIILRVPIRASKREINELIENKSRWILKKIGEIENKKKNIKQHKFITGEIFQCLDEDYELILLDDSKYAFKNVKNKLYLHSDFQNQAREIIIDWYRYKAKKYIFPKTFEYANKMRLTFNQIRITSAKTRWGSCSNKKNLNFSWRLIIAPAPIVDYVIVHELTHLVEMNHSQKFWNIVSSVKPNYKIYETWLKDYGYLLDI